MIFIRCSSRGKTQDTQNLGENRPRAHRQSGSDFWIKYVGIRDESLGGRCILGTSVVKVTGGRLQVCKNCEILQQEVQVSICMDSWEVGRTLPKLFTHRITNITTSQTSPEILLARLFLSFRMTPSHPGTTTTEKRGHRLFIWPFFP